MGTTGVVAMCTALSRLVGFARVSLISFLFGGTGQADVLNLVFQIPNNLRRLLAEGALSAAFIPVLGDTLSVDMQTTQRARAFVQSVVLFQLFAFTPLLLVATVFSTSLTQTLFDFPVVEQVLQANLLFKILIWYTLPVSLNAIFMAILNTHGHFTIPALSPLVSSAAVIVTTLVLHTAFGIYAVGIGILIGGVAQLAMHIPHLVRYRYRPTATNSTPVLRNPDLKRMLRKWVLIMSSAAVLFINQQVALYFASGLEVGSGSAMIYALTFWQLPFGILGISVITVLYPRMSTQYARGSMDDLQRTFRSGARYLSHVLLPASIFFLFCGEDVISVALQRGQFTAVDTARTASVLRAYSVGLLGVALFQYMQRFYYAVHKTAFTLKVLVFVVVVDIFCSLWLKETALRVSGLGWANSISFWLGAIVLYHQLPRVAHIPRRASARTDGRGYVPRLAAALLISSAVPALYAYAPLSAVSTVVRLALLLLCGCLYGALVLLLYKWFRITPHPREFLFSRRSQ